mgnify:FL=1
MTKTALAPRRYSASTELSQKGGHMNWWGVLKKLKIEFRERSTGAIMAHCVFHIEQTPSLRFWPESGRFHCFGCGSEGSAEEFLARYFFRYRHNRVVLRNNEVGAIRQFLETLPDPPNPDQLDLPFNLL